MSDVTINGLTISLGMGAAQKKILNEVGFSVASGESFGLVGESGSGKSTILRCFARLLTFWTGEISIAGRPVAPDPCR